MFDRSVGRVGSVIIARIARGEFFFSLSLLTNPIEKFVVYCPDRDNFRSGSLCLIRDSTFGIECFHRDPEFIFQIFWIARSEKSLWQRPIAASAVRMKRWWIPVTPGDRVLFIFIEPPLSLSLSLSSSPVPALDIFFSNFKRSCHSTAVFRTL